MSKRRQRRRHAVENKDLMRAMLGLRSSSAASKHVLKKHKGTRAERQRKAVRDSEDT